MTIGRVAVGDHDGRRRMLEARLDVVEADDPRDLGDVECAVADGDAVRTGEAPRDPPRCGRVGRARGARNRVDDALFARADEQRPGGGERHRARTRDGVAEDLDRETGRQGDAIETVGRSGRGDQAQHDDRDKEGATESHEGYYGHE